MALLTPEEREIYETSLVENSLFNRDSVNKATKCYKVIKKPVEGSRAWMSKTDNNAKIVFHVFLHCIIHRQKNDGSVELLMLPMS